MNFHDVVNVLNMLGVQVDGSPTKQITCSCPLAKWTHPGGVDKRPSFSVRCSDDTSVFKCFSCGEQGTLSSLVESYAVLSGNDELRKLSMQLLHEDKLSLKTRLARRKEVVDTGSVVLKDSVLDGFKPLHPKVISYFASRGFGVDDVNDFDVRYDERHDRAVFPVRNVRNQLTGAVGRSLSDGPKFYNYFGFESGKNLGGVQKVDPSLNRIFLVEGMFDVIKMHRLSNFFDGNAVCTFGTNLSKSQISTLTTLAKPVIVCYDGDPAGNKGAYNAKVKLKDLVPIVRQAKIPTSYDIGSMTQDQIKLSLESR